MRTKLLIALSFLAVAGAGCSAESATRVMDQSVVATPSTGNVIAMSPGDPRWHLVLPTGASSKVVETKGAATLVLSSARPGSVGPLEVEFFATSLPARAVGSTYVLRVRLQMQRVSVPIYSKLRLNFADGGSSIFVGAPTLARQGASARRASEGTRHGWVTNVVIARAKRPLASVDAVLAQSSARARFSGVLRIEDPRLLLVRR